MQFRVTTLCDNYVPAGGRGLVGEQRPGTLKDTPGLVILVDNGQGLGPQTNPRQSGIDMNRVGHTVMSNVHYDHCGDQGRRRDMRMPRNGLNGWALNGNQR